MNFWIVNNKRGNKILEKLLNGLKTKPNHSSIQPTNQTNSFEMPNEQQVVRITHGNTYLHEQTLKYKLREQLEEENKEMSF